MKLPVRYWAMQSSTFDDNLESKVHHVTPVWEIGASETALVLVDCWGSHAWKSHLERSSEIITNRIAPLIDAVRAAGMTIVHAPAAVAARKYPQWTRYADDDELNPSGPAYGDWPPEDFRRRSGEYAQYELVSLTALPPVPEAEDIAEPIEPKPDDMVIATGAQLHRLLEDRRIVHLLYCGFATNSCVILRDYGMIAMHRRGYNAMLVRDCTAAIENSTTIADEAMMEYAIKDIERSMASTTSSEVIAACKSESSRSTQVG